MPNARGSVSTFSFDRNNRNNRNTRITQQTPPSGPKHLLPP